MATDREKRQHREAVGRKLRVAEAVDNLTGAALTLRNTVDGTELSDAHIRLVLEAMQASADAIRMELANREDR